MIMVLPPRLPPAVVHPVIRGAHIATASGYLSTAGLAALLYDHVLTFGDEVNLIWTAPRSFPKWVFLTNHYLAEVCLIAVANEEPGLNGHLSDQKFVAAVTCYAMISTFVANLLGFVRVIILWDKSPRVVLGLSIALTMSFLATITSTVASIIYTEPTVRYDPSLKLCYPTKSSKSFAIIWATPLLAFDITVLAFMIYNSLSNPRDLKTTLKGILYRDGILFFLLVALIRALNLLLVIVTEPDLAGFPAYFSWAIITLACRHLLIHIHSCEQEADLYATRPSSMETDSEPAIKLHSYKVNCH